MNSPRPRVRPRGDRARLRMIPDCVFLRVGMSKVDEPPGACTVVTSPVLLAKLHLEPGPGPATAIGGGLVLCDQPLVASPLDLRPRREAVRRQSAGVVDAISSSGGGPGRRPAAFARLAPAISRPVARSHPASQEAPQIRVLLSRGPDSKRWRGVPRR